MHHHDVFLKNLETNLKPHKGGLIEVFKFSNQLIKYREFRLRFSFIQEISQPN